MLARDRSLRDEARRVLVSREADGQEEVYNLTEPLHHSYIVDGFVVANCTEYMHVDDSACNLASLNLMKFRRPDGSFDVDVLRARVDIMFLAQEISSARRATRPSRSASTRAPSASSGSATRTSAPTSCPTAWPTTPTRVAARRRRSRR